VPVVVPSVVESIPTFLLIKERVSSLWRKDFNTKALIQASMLGQSYKDMLREVGPLVSMHSIICFVARSWGIVEFWGNEFERAEAESQKA